MKKKWTVLLIPGPTGEVHDLTFSARLVILAFLLLTAALLASAMFCAKTVRSRNEENINTINQLQSDMAKRDRELDSVRTEFSELLELEEKLRAIAGLEPRDVSGVGGPGEGGQGGPAPEEEFPSEGGEFAAAEFSIEVSDSTTDGLVESLVATQDSFSGILKAFERQQRRLASVPSINPVASRSAWISSRFAYRIDPIDGKRRFHAGIDLVAPRKTPIIAPADGVVTFSGWKAGLGREIEISHGY
ncbi:MAG: M23 family metallopeptidase, partial [Candidatus Lindowbacteria bacterium]|nr:M23 family metallopeptidase [Candidatus Lindowbacteria bacterium]